MPHSSDYYDVATCDCSLKLSVHGFRIFFGDILLIPRRTPTLSLPGSTDVLALGCPTRCAFPYRRRVLSRKRSQALSHLASANRGPGQSIMRSGFVAAFPVVLARTLQTVVDLQTGAIRLRCRYMENCERKPQLVAFPAVLACAMPSVS